MKKNNDELILKYLSGLLNKDEEELFLEKLNTSDELKQRYAEFKNNLDEINIDVTKDVNEKYFASFTQRIYEKLENNQLRILQPVYAYTSALVLVFAISINLFEFGSSSPTDSNYPSVISYIIDSMTESDYEFLNDYFDTDLLTDGSRTNSNIDAEIYLDLEYDNYDYEDYFQSEYLMLSDLELHEQFSKEDINEIYNELSNKKIL